MRAIASILIAALVGAAFLQGCFAIWHPSSFGRFAEFPMVLLYAVIITATVFSFVVAPSFLWLHRKGRRVSSRDGALAGALLGGLIGCVLFLDPAHLSMNLVDVWAGAISGAVAVGLYARLSSKAVP